jgi:acetolactate synthase regulatory subunit
MPNEIRNLHVRTQAKLGAVDRILGALTHRGIIPTNFRCDTLEAGVVNIYIDFICKEDINVIKLCKHLDRQVYTLTIEDISHQPVAPPMGISRPSHPSQRRMQLTPMPMMA